MKKIALFSDIHSNLPALEAFFSDLETRNTDAVYCLGDLVGYNVWPNEVINEIRKRGLQVDVAFAGSFSQRHPFAQASGIACPFVLVMQANQCATPCN